MAKTITRKTLTLWGGTGATSSFAQFGSETAGAPVKTKDVATIQSLAAWADGWQSAVALGQAPYMEDMNALMYVFAYQQFYSLQEGVAEFDTGTTYFIGSLVKRTGTSEIYMSLTDTNLNNALPTAGASNTNWQFVYGIISGSFRIGGPLAMNTQKVTGLAPGTAESDVPNLSQLQVRQWVQSTSNTIFTTTSSSLVNTNNTGTITPTSSSRRVLVMAFGDLEIVATGLHEYIATLARGSTNIGGTFGFSSFGWGQAQDIRVQTALAYIDSPATTSPTTYNVQIKSNSGDSLLYGRGTQTMILAEVI